MPSLNFNTSISATAGTVTYRKGTMAGISINEALIDVIGINGVIHTINKVLLPSGNNIFKPEKSAVEILQDFFKDNLYYSNNIYIYQQNYSPDETLHLI